MELDPHQVLEGTIISCYATRATTAYVYLRYEYPLCRRRMQAAIDECYAAGYLGQKILGSGFVGRPHPSRRGGLCLRRRDGPDREHRGPPGVAAHQAAVSRPSKGCSANPRWSITWKRSLRETHRRSGRGLVPLHGHAAAPDNPRDPGSFGPKLYGLSGHVNRPGCYEAPLGITVRQLIDDFGGGVWKGRRAKAVVPGGLSTGVMTEAEFDTPLDFSAPDAGRLLGARHGVRRW